MGRMGRSTGGGRWRKAIVAGAVGIVASGGVANGWVMLAALPFSPAAPTDRRVRDVAIVPGGLVWRNEPGALVGERLKTALALYEQGKVHVVLVSGDEGAGETTAMRTWLEAHGVPPERVMSDTAGTRTIETMRNAARRFGVQSAFVCTQSLHMARTLFLARHSGIDAVGATAALNPPMTPTVIARELLKNALAFAEGIAR
jgi:vancomycin permeability regulator SanA